LPESFDHDATGAQGRDVRGLAQRSVVRALRVRWTPLRGCKDWNAARARAKALLGPGRTSQSVAEAGHWATQGELLLAPLLHVAALCGLTLREVVAWAANPDQLEEPLGLLQEFDGAAAGAKEAHAHLRGVARQEAKHRSNVVSTVTTALHPYSGHVLEEAARATDADWDPEQFLSGLNTLFVIAPVDSEVDSPAPIVVGVLSELYGAVRKLSDASGGRLPHPTLWVLDEVANICPLPALPQWLAEAAGRGLTFVLGVQDYAQLSERWGRDGATAMWSNTNHQGGVSGDLQPRHAAPAGAARRPVLDPSGDHVDAGQGKPAGEAQANDDVDEPSAAAPVDGGRAVWDGGGELPGIPPGLAHALSPASEPCPPDPALRHLAQDALATGRGGTQARRQSSGGVDPTRGPPSSPLLRFSTTVSTGARRWVEGLAQQSVGRAFLSVGGAELPTVSTGRSLLLQEI